MVRISNHIKIISNVVKLHFPKHSHAAVPVKYVSNSSKLTENVFFVVYSVIIKKVRPNLTVEETTNIKKVVSPLADTSLASPLKSLVYTRAKRSSKQCVVL